MTDVAEILESRADPTRADQTPTFTFFTPTRNRAQVLHRVYDSLRVQTRRDFEWVVVDNCSEDNTREVVSQWFGEAPFPIKYVRPSENRGLGNSYQLAMSYARGELIFTIRDADAFEPNTIERMADHWYAIPAAERDGYVGVSCNTHDENHVLIGTRFPSDVFDSDYCESTYRSHVSGEKWGMQRLDLMREYMLPPPKGYLGWYPESIVWRRIAQRYQTRYINDEACAPPTTRMSRARVSEGRRLGGAMPMACPSILARH
ncbi:MAG: glycosyltransferase family A protein [Burkholderiaceae bacterium]